jgi:uncharacterized delta-60 repeat protein
MKKKFIRSFLFILILFPIESKPQIGLDESFGNKGIVTTAINLNKSLSEALSVKFQRDGKIVAGGFYNNENNNYDFAVARYNPDGSPDNSFGTNGIVILPLSSGFDEISSIAIQTDSADGNIEKIIASGFIQNSDDADFALIRFNPDGSIDSSFGRNGSGIVTSGIKDLSDHATSIIIQNDGKILIAGYQSNGHDDDFMLARYDASGIPDYGFGNANGIVTTEVSGFDWIYSIAVQDDGKIVAAGSSDAGNSFALARYSSNGALDPSFGNNGIVTTGVGSPQNNLAFSTAIQADGKIIVGGQSYNNNKFNFTLLRYKSNGELDSAFNNNGIVITDLGNNSGINSIFIDRSDAGNEKIVAAGSSFNGVDLDITLARYNSGGKLDDSFGNGGILLVPRGKSTEKVSAADYQIDRTTGKIKKIVTAGYQFDGSNIDFALASFDGSGIINKRFGSNGIVSTLIENTHSILNAIAVQTSVTGEEKIIAAGYTGKGNNSFMTLARYNSDGSIDSSFGTDENGIVIKQVPKPESIRALLIQNNGKIVAVAYSTVLRFNRDGILDTLFGVNGIVNLPITATDQTNHSAAIQEDGKIVVAGSFYDGSNFDYAVVRIDSEGFLDPAFGEVVHGIAVTPIGTSTDFANSLVIQDDGKIVVTGDYRATPNKLAIALVRYNSNGILDKSFGINGIVKLSVGPVNDNILSAAIQQDGKIIIAGSSGGFDNYDLTLVRFNRNGSVDSTFGVNGIVTTPIGNLDDIAVAVTLQNVNRKQTKIIAAGDFFEGSYENFALLKYNLDGSLDKTFGTNGIITMHIGSSSSAASSVLVQSDSKIVVGGSSNSTNADYTVFTLARFYNNGTTDVNEKKSGNKVASFKLEQNYPNPFNPATIIKYSIPYVETGHAPVLQVVQLKIFDILGKEVATLVNKEQQPGNYEISLNAENLPSGVYFYQLRAGNLQMVKKMILIR